MVKVPAITPNALDRAIGWVAPTYAAKRLQGRFAFNALSGGYNGGRRDRRPTSSWQHRLGDADDALLPDLNVLQERSQDLVRNNPLASGALNTKCTNIIGPGLTIRSEIDREFLGLTDDAADKLEAGFEREFNLWADSPDADITRTQTFAEMQDLIFRSMKETGDVLVIKRWKERPGSPFAFCLQVIETTRLSNPNWQRDTKTLAGGIEVDSDGAPVAYHIANAAPGARVRGSTATTWTKIPAFDAATGRRMVLHLFQRKRPGQSRGIPDFAVVIEALKQLGNYTDGELDAAVVSSFFSVFIKTESGEGLAPVGPTSETGATSTDDDIKLSPGMVTDLAKGEDIVVANPGRPNDSFDPFVQAVLRQIGAHLELPFEVLIKHFTASYSAARGALLEAWNYYRRERKWLARRLCAPVFEEVIGECIARGRCHAPGFFADAAITKAYAGGQWHGPGMPQLDPLKENKADEIAEDRQWKTSAEIVSERTGGDWDRNIKRRGKEEEKRRKYDLLPAPSSPLAVEDMTGDAEQDKPENEEENVA